MLGCDDVYESALDGNVKSELSPTGNFDFSFSRASSVGSVNAISCSSASSTHNTDDEDSDAAAVQSNSFKERRREAHTHAEQKRRDAIKKGYEELQGVVPTCSSESSSSSSHKLSKATILQKTIDYIQYLMQQKKKHEDELENLKKEATALKIMKSNYEQMVRNCQNVDHQGLGQISEEEKFYVFQQLMDNLFQSFNTSVAVGSFEELSQCVTTWLEDNCKPNMLRELTASILTGANMSSNNNNNTSSNGNNNH